MRNARGVGEAAQDVQSEGQPIAHAGHWLHTQDARYDLTVEEVTHGRVGVGVSREEFRCDVTGVLGVGGEGHAIQTVGHAVGADPALKVIAALGDDPGHQFGRQQVNLDPPLFVFVPVQ